EFQLLAAGAGVVLVCGQRTQPGEPLYAAGPVTSGSGTGGRRAANPLLLCVARRRPSGGNERPAVYVDDADDPPTDRLVSKFYCVQRLLSFYACPLQASLAPPLCQCRNP